MIARALPLLLAFASVLPARADDVADARAYYREGTQLYKEGKYRAAIEAFDNAYRKKPHGAIHYNLAQCREKLSEWPAALRSYHDYLREVPDAKDRAAVLAAIQRLEGKLAQGGAQVLLLYSDPLGAEVRIDGKAKGTTPMHLVLPPGAYAVTLSRVGYAQAAREVVLGPMASQVMDVTLKPAASAPVPLPPPPAAVPSTAPPPDLKPQPAPQAAPMTGKAPVPVKSPAGGRVWTWVAAGVGAAALGAAVYYGMDAQKKSDELLDGTVRGDGEAAALASDAESSAKRANVLYGVAGVAGAAGATMFFVEGRF